MDFFYTKIENSGPATARIGIKGHAPLSQFLNSSFILQFRHEIIIKKLLRNIEILIQYSTDSKSRLFFVNSFFVVSYKSMPKTILMKLTHYQDIL